MLYLVPTMVLDGNSLTLASGDVLVQPGGIKKFETLTTGLGYQDGGEYVGDVGEYAWPCPEAP